MTDNCLNTCEELETAPPEPSRIVRLFKSLSGSPVHLAFVLAILALSVAALLAFANEATKDAVALRAKEDLQASLGQVIPKSRYDKGPAANTITLTDKELGDMLIYRAAHNGAVSAVAFQMTGKGYAGDIVLLMGVGADGDILGVRILSHAETPGLGDKIDIRKSPWVQDFNGRTLNNPALPKWKVKKDGGIFDQFSGATITPRAVVLAVKQGLLFFERNRERLLATKGKTS